MEWEAAAVGLAVWHHSRVLHRECPTSFVQVLRLLRKPQALGGLTEEAPTGAQHLSVPGSKSDTKEST